MIYLPIENLDWVMVDLFEIFQSYSTRLAVIMRAFISRVHSQLSDGTQIDVFWLKGDDPTGQYYYVHLTTSSMENIG
jgi:hypothetical protein